MEGGGSRIGVEGLVEGLGFSREFRVASLGFWIDGRGSRIKGLGSRVYGCGLSVYDFGFMV